MSEIKTVFIVTQGSYSDYKIVSVWDTLEEAQKHAPATTIYGDEADIEEWVLNRDEEKTVIQWRASIDPRTGNIVVGNKPSQTSRIDHPEVRRNWGLQGVNWYGWGYGPTPEHARKSLADALAKAKAEHNKL